MSGDRHIALLEAPVRPIEAGDDFVVRAGCDKRLETCRDRFANDCLGLVRGVWREVVGSEPFPIPPYSRDWGERGIHEPLAEAARKVMLELPVADGTPGALILFRMRTGAVAKHCGILVATDRFIHAYERTGVIQERLDSTWRRRLAFAFLFPAG